MTGKWIKKSTTTEIAMIAATASISQYNRSPHRLLSSPIRAVGAPWLYEIKGTKTDHYLA